MKAAFFCCARKSFQTCHMMIGMKRILVNAMTAVQMPVMAESRVRLPDDSALKQIPGSRESRRKGDRNWFSDPLAEALTAVAPMRRLEDIGFLGAIDYIHHGTCPDSLRHRHSRLEHSIAVAELADAYARTVDMPENRRQTLLAAALLHDIGHGPLSHSLEPVFEAEFGIDHRKMTRRIIEGESVWGRDILSMLKQSAIDVEEVIALIDGQLEDDIGFLFSSPINIDTLDGITRCQIFATAKAPFLSAKSIVHAWASDSRLPQMEFDAFWALKHEMYNSFIHAPFYAALDVIAQAYMRDNLSRFSPDDFLLTTEELRARHPELFRYLFCIASRESAQFCELPTNWLCQSVTLKSRTFTIHEQIALEGNESMNKRYKQSKDFIVISLEEMINET